MISLLSCLPPHTLHNERAFIGFVIQGCQRPSIMTDQGKSSDIQSFSFSSVKWLFLKPRGQHPTPNPHDVSSNCY